MTTGSLASSGQASIAASIGGNPGAVTVGPGGGASAGSHGVTLNAGSGAGGTSSTNGTAAVGAGGLGGVGGSAATDAASADAGGAAGAPPDPYAPRSGPFKVLVYSRTALFRHPEAISSGKIALEQIAETQGFELTFAEDNELITATGLADYELVFFLHPSGDVFGPAEEQAFEEWIRQGGAFVGMHSATDTEYGWAFYTELTGQSEDDHGPQDQPGTIIWQAGAETHPAVAGLPDPWPRVDEWMKFSRESEWASKPGFKILGRLEADGLPVIWCREHDNYRAFYTAIGHSVSSFQEPEVKQHLTGAILWAVRREHLL